MGETVLSFMVPNEVKRLLRLRAAHNNTSISEIARSVLLAALPEPDDDELCFLAKGSQSNEGQLQERE